jgi:WD40 repeat protein
MTDDRKSRTVELFHEALERDPKERTEFLREACAGDSGLFRRLKDLLDSYAEVETVGPIPQEPTEQILDSDTLVALAERYEDIKPIGIGGMGLVLRAHDRELDKVVALKMLHPSIANDPRAIERFRSEIRLALEITHTNVCRTYGLERINGKLLISMEYVEGETLRRILDRVRGVSVPQGISWTLEICDGLAAAHNKGIIHRDLKPENIMIDQDGHVKLMDFGIARSMENLTAGTVIGTPQYMSPEQASGKALAPTTDIYSLGLILYELFTGVRQDCKHPLTPREANHYLDTHIDSVIRRCLHEKAEGRFKEAGELRAAFIGRRTATARGPNRRIALASTCAVLAAIAAGYFLLPNNRMHHDRVDTIAFSSDGRTLVSGSEDTTIKVWDVLSQREKSTLSGHEARVSCLAFSDDGRWLASGSDDRTARMWSTETGKLSKILPDPDKRTIAQVAVNRDGSRLASASGDSIDIWDVPSGHIMHVVKHTDTVNAIAFSPDGVLLASGSDDRTVKIWDVETGRLEQDLIHEQPVAAVAFSPDAQWLASATQKQIKMWSRRSWTAVHSLSDEDTVHGISFSRDGQWLASDTENVSVTLWMSPWERSVSKIKIDADEEDVAFSPDLHYFAVARNDGAIALRKLRR